jgi:hypothetical protein
VRRTNPSCAGPRATSAARHTHFFWTFLNNREGEDHNISRSLHQSLIEGFMEDKHLIEAQQKVLDADPGSAPQRAAFLRFTSTIPAATATSATSSCGVSFSSSSSTPNSNANSGARKVKDESCVAG